MPTRIPIYSPLPACAVDPQEAVRAYEKAFENRWCAINFNRMRDTFPALPWALDETLGTTWHDVLTYNQITITRVELSRRIRQAPPTDKKLSPDSFPPAHYEWDFPGLWVGRRFVVERYVRVDHLPVEARLAWLRFGVERATETVTIYRHPDPWYVANVPDWPVFIKWTEEMLDEARAMLHAFCQAHDLPDAPEGPGAGAGKTSQPSAPAQPALL